MDNYSLEQLTNKFNDIVISNVRKFFRSFQWTNIQEDFLIQIINDYLKGDINREKGMPHN